MELLFEGTWESIRKDMRAVLGEENVQVAITPTTLPTISALQESSPKVEKTKTTKAAQVATQTAPAQPATQSVATAALPTEGAFDYKKIESLIPKAVELVGRGKVVTLLEKYGAKKGSELKSNDYAAFYAECQTLVDGASLA